MTFYARTVMRPTVGKSGQVFVGWTLLSHLFTFFHIDIDSLNAKNCAERIIGVA
jgi:hypothetical protein